MDELHRLLSRERQAEFQELARRSRLAREAKTARRAAATAFREGNGGRIRRTAASMSLGLSRELWLVEIGIFLNMLGYGAVLPFEIIYLHDGRGFSLGVAGLVVGVITGAAVVTLPWPAR